MKKIYGYARVSTKEQKEDRQMNALKNFGISGHNIFLDKLSGKNFDRPAYKKLLKRLLPGDVLVVKSIDRLGRNYDDILHQWRLIIKEKHVDIVVLDMPLPDTRGERGDLTSSFIADLVLQIFSYVAQMERELNRQRQAEGIATAKAKGVKFGRPPLKQPAEFQEVYEAWMRGEISAREAGRRLGMNYKTFQNRAGQISL